MIQSKIRLLQKLHPLLSTLSTTKRQSKHEVSFLKGCNYTGKPRNKTQNHKNVRERPKV